MQQRLSLVTLGVADLKKSRAFYDALGWQVADEENAENVVAYNLQSMTLALFPWENLAKDASISPIRTGYSAFTLAYNVNTEAEVDKTIEIALKAGAKPVKPPQKTFWGGYSGYFADPDGNLWEIAHNPFSPLGKEGQFQWGGAK